MNSVNRLGLIAALTTVIVLAVLFAAWWGVKKYWLTPPLDSAPASVETTAGEQDSDGDGLPDLVENLYKTNPQKADTDGDLVSDGDEVTVGRDPLAVEGATWTDKYLASLPDDTPRDQIMDQAQLTAFVAANKGQLLPTLPDGLIKTSAEAGKATTTAYLDAISPSQNEKLSAITPADIESAWKLSFQNNQPETMDSLVTKLHQNVDILQSVVAPKELLALHTKVVSAAHALTNNTELLRDTQADWVGGLIGAKNIDELGVVFQDLKAQVTQLRNTN